MAHAPSLLCSVEAKLWPALAFIENFDIRKSVDGIPDGMKLGDYGLRPIVDFLYRFFKLTIRDKAEFSTHLSYDNVVLHIEMLSYTIHVSMISFYHKVPRIEFEEGGARALRMAMAQVSSHFAASPLSLCSGVMIRLLILI